ncbi:MAG: endopeptidase La, partial [Acidimicrobiales bacterium]
MVVPVQLDDSERQAAIDAAQAGASDRVLLVPRLEGKYATVGVVATIEQLGKLPGGEPAAVLRATGRARVGSGVTGPGSALWVEAEILDDVVDGDAVAELAREYKSIVVSILQQRGAWQVIDSVQRISDPGELSDLAGYAPYVTNDQKLWLLETVEVSERLAKLIEWGREHLAELDVAERIRSDVHEGMEKSQREFLLRQQLQAIRKELGESEPDGADDYRARVEAADLPDKVLEAALREVGRLERASDQSPEAGWIRTWLDTVLELPWNVRTDDNNDVKAAREVLDADHEGLEDVKDRITEYLAVRKLRQERGIEADPRSGAILTLIGPPGTGKTSIGESIARATGREFVRMSLGGVRDEAEIRGHRRTYIGALPGRLVRALRDAGTMNPVILLDEVDKVGADWRGDPSSALLEVLDPAQNHSFRDHYLDVELDLSQVLFIATANQADTIPGPLLDRMEVISFDGYTGEEKLAIAKGYLWPRQRDRNGLLDGEVVISDELVRTVISEYTREAGVRNLERELGKLLRKTATRIASDKATAPVEIDLAAIRDALGRQKLFQESAARTAVPGVATGLAVTGAGGDVLFVEATSMSSHGSSAGLVLTGQLGDVMKESAKIALSYVRGHAAELGIPEDAFEEREFHIHVPAGAIPKDGPSAGVTMVTALASLLSGRPVKHTVGMTGEVTLQGRVLPIGGLKQKALAANAAGLT